MYRSYIPSVKYDQPLLSPRFVFFFNTGHDFLNALKLPGNNNLVQLLIILVIISAFVDKKKMYQEMIIWQITAGAQHNSFADTIIIEP